MLPARGSTPRGCAPPRERESSRTPSAARRARRGASRLGPSTHRARCRDVSHRAAEVECACASRVERGPRHRLAERIVDLADASAIPKPTSAPSDAGAARGPSSSTAAFGPRSKSSARASGSCASDVTRSPVFSSPPRSSKYGGQRVGDGLRAAPSNRPTIDVPGDTEHEGQACRERMGQGDARVRGQTSE